MRSKIYKFDFFGLPVTLSYLNDYKYRTNLGLCMSWSFFISIIVYLSFIVVPSLIDDQRREFTYISEVRNSR